MKFTVIFVKFAIRTAHGLVVGLAALHARTVRLARLLVNDAVSAKPAILVLAGSEMAILSIVC